MKHSLLFVSIKVVGRPVFVVVLAAAFLMVSCISAENDFRKVQGEMSDVMMKEFDKTISDDSFMGRRPCTPSEKKTTEFLVQELSKIGFEPAFRQADGSFSYFQEVPLISIASQVKASIHGLALHSSRPVEKIELKDVRMVFCGFGIVAPKYGFNSYKDVDVKGKIAVVLINDPGLYLSLNSGLSETAGTVTSENGEIPFKGSELTYYGRWTYKFEEAARQGAAGVIIIHEEYGAGYNFNVASRSSKMANLYINTPDLMNNCAVEGWIEGESAAQLLAKEGYNLQDLRMKACSSDFKSFPLTTKLSVSITNTMEESASVNVAGILRGSSKPDEAVVVSGHWDYFGVDTAPKPGATDTIYNGAVDNGTTMAWALEIGRAYARLKQRPARSLMIFFPTAEEQGLLGSKYYVEHPAIEMNKTVACINDDMMYPRGKMKDLMIIGKGYYPQLDLLYSEAAARQERYITGDPNAHTGMFFRSDQLAFHLKGVPSSWAFGCYDSREYGKEWALETWDYFLKNVYHTTNDDYNPDWDWSGIVEDAQVAFEVIYRLTSCNNPFQGRE